MVHLGIRHKNTKYTSVWVDERAFNVALSDLPFPRTVSCRELVDVGGALYLLAK